MNDPITSLEYKIFFVNKKWAENLPDHKELTKKTSNKPCKEESLHLYFNTKIYNCQQKKEDTQTSIFLFTARFLLAQKHIRKSKGDKPLQLYFIS